MSETEIVTDDVAPEQETPEPTGQEKPSTILDAPEKEVASPADWPEDWRQKLAGDDETYLKQLGRYKSPQDVAKALKAAQTKISAGNAKEPLAEDADEATVAAWRKDNGIPEKPDGYFEALNSGVVFGDEDKPILSDFMAQAHEMNAPPAMVDKFVSWYFGQQEQVIAAQSEADHQRGIAMEESLRAEWGNEFRAQKGAIANFLDSAPTAEDGTSLKDMLIGARFADGTKVLGQPDMVRWLASMANDANPAGFVAPAGGGSQAASVDDEISAIQKTMRENRAAYDKDTKMQERYRVLLEAREKLSSRAA